jgi:outer membrane protein OmpA-like peptidoglycan-associated protein
VTIEESPAIGSVPAPFFAAWTAIEVPSSLAITRSGATITLSGHLSAPSLHQAIVVALTDAVGPEAVDAATLESGAFVRGAKFAVEGALPLFLKRYFVTPGALKFTADQDKVHVSGHATPSMQREWLELLEPLSREATLEAQLQVFPSVYHFPGRVQESVIADEPLTILEDVLRASVISFDPGHATAHAAEQPKISAAADAILGAGPGAQIVVGGHVDLSGDPKNNLTMARRRAEGVVADLVSKGVPRRVLETAVFEAVPGGEDHGRQVELLIK